MDEQARETEKVRSKGEISDSNRFLWTLVGMTIQLLCTLQSKIQSLLFFSSCSLLGHSCPPPPPLRCSGPLICVDSLKSAQLSFKSSYCTKQRPWNHGKRREFHSPRYLTYHIILTFPWYFLHPKSKRGLEPILHLVWLCSHSRRRWKRH